MTRYQEQGENEFTRAAKREAARTGEDVASILKRMQRRGTRSRFRATSEDCAGAEVSTLSEPAKTPKMMKWYAAHLIFYFKLKKRRQRSFRVWENIVLIRARNPDEGYAKAERRGREEELLGEGDSLRWGGHPAKMIFAGVRKLTSCVDEDKRPTDGTEVSYIEMDLESEEAIRKLVAVEPVAVAIADGFPDDDSAADVLGAGALARHSG